MSMWISVTSRYISRAVTANCSNHCINWCLHSKSVLGNCRAYELKTPKSFHEHLKKIFPVLRFQKAFSYENSCHFFKVSFKIFFFSVRRERWSHHLVSIAQGIITAETEGLVWFNRNKICLQDSQTYKLGFGLDFIKGGFKNVIAPKL